MPGQQNVWLWDKAAGVWEEAPASVLSARTAGAGLCLAGERKLYWVHCTPSAANSVWELTDALAGGGAVQVDAFYAGKESHMVSFSPPMQFGLGIYVETLTNITSLVIGYI